MHGFVAIGVRKNECVVKTAGQVNAVLRTSYNHIKMTTKLQNNQYPKHLKSAEQKDIKKKPLSDW